MNGIVFAETVRRHLASIGYISFLIFVAIIGVFVATFNSPASAWPSLITALAVIAGSAIIGPEFTTGSLQLIVSKPVARHAYLLGRVAGVWACAGLAAFCALSAETITRVIIGARLPWQRLLEVFASELVVALLAVSLLTMLGSMTSSYFNAAIYIGVWFALLGAEVILGAMRLRSAFIDQHPELQQVVTSIDDAIFPSAPDHLTNAWLLRSTALIVTSLALACLTFQRREVPYGAD